MFSFCVFQFYSFLVKRISLKTVICSRIFIRCILFFYQQVSVNTILYYIFICLSGFVGNNVLFLIIIRFVLVPKWKRSVPVFLTAAI